MNIPTIEEVITQDRKTLTACPHKLDCASCNEDVCVMIASVADFPSQYGRFRIVGFINNKDEKDHIVILKGEIGDGEGILTRIHSASLAGDALGSLRCDCGPQLHHALQLIEAEGVRVLEHVQHELPSHDHDRHYMATKKDRFGHLLTLDHDTRS